MDRIGELSIPTRFCPGSGKTTIHEYASVFPDSQVGEGHASAAEDPSTKAGEELTVEFTVLGQAYIGLNGGPIFKPNEAVSFMILTENQQDTDRYWNAISRFNWGCLSIPRLRHDRSHPL